MSPMTQTILISSLATGTIITTSSHHWLLAWLGLEINTLAMLPHITKQHHPRATEAATKYFLTQAAAAALILLASLINTWQTGQWTIMQPTHNSTALILTVAIAMKLGLAPTHFWYPEVLQGSTMMTALIMSTWQKLAPLALLYMMHNHLSLNLVLVLGLLSTMIGGWSGLNQTQLRKIMAFSSIAHMGWLTIALTMGHSLTTLTMIIYLAATTAMFTSMLTASTKNITDLTTTWSNSSTLLTMMMLTLMSLGGLPPLTGFMPKLLIIKELTLHQLTPLATTLALMSLPSLFFYTRLAYFTTLTNPPTTTTTKNTWRFKNNHTHLMTTATTTTALLLPITPLLYNM